KIFPLYINVGLGFFATKYLDVQRHSVAALLIYIIGPIVVLSATMSVEINVSVAFLPIFLYIFGSIIAFATLFLFGKNWNDPTGNILAFS
ncbi:MAG TPA: transporter, partial [Colwellia sp.]|nr:transporter [Colwellia sp.]